MPRPGGPWSFYPALPVPLGLGVATTLPHECPYLPGRTSVSRGFRCERVPGWIYQRLMDAGFRRSGDAFYQNACPGCRACTALRLSATAFVPRKSQRRLLRRNADVTLTCERPSLSDEKHALYARYLEARHDRTMSNDRDDLEAFLYRSTTETVEVAYRDPGGRLVAVGLCDVTPLSLSSVYFYFDPGLARRGLGIFGALRELDLARRLGLAWYYPGFWIEGCPKMAYKARLGPCELLGTDGRWRAFDTAQTAVCSAGSVGLKVAAPLPEL